MLVVCRNITLLDYHLIAYYFGMESIWDAIAYLLQFAIFCSKWDIKLVMKFLLVCHIYSALMVILYPQFGQVII